MKKKIAVCGSASCNDSEVLKRAFQVGEEIAKSDCILLTGATTGVSYEAAKGAKSKNGFVIGISPAENLDEHIQRFRKPTEHFDVLIFTGQGIKGRNVTLIRSCDAAIFISGSLGTLNEFTIALDEGKPIAVLKDSGGISPKMREIAENCRKPGHFEIIEERSPGLGIEKLLAAIYK